MLTLALAVSATAAEPCYGWTWPDVVDGPRLSVEYDATVADLLDAQALFTAADDAWPVYAGLGFPTPIGSPSIAIEADALNRGGFAVTEPCAGQQHPKLFVFAPGASLRGFGERAAVHELFHAVQYAYDPQLSYIDHYGAWPWWAEGTAAWAERKALGPGQWDLPSLEDYVAYGHFELHQDITAAVFPERNAFLYGTSMVAYSLEAHAGLEAIGQTFEEGAKLAGQPAWFPDVLKAIGVDFDAFWAEHLGRLPTLDYAFGDRFAAIPAPVSRINTLPGTATGDPDRRPQGLGWAIHRIVPDVADGTPLTVSFTGQAGPRWHWVLVTAPRSRPGAATTVVHDAQTDGGATAAYTLDYASPLWIVVSPEIDGGEPGFDYQIEVTEAAETPVEGGCRTAPGFAGALSLVGLLAVRRRRTS